MLPILLSGLLLAGDATTNLAAFLGGMGIAASIAFTTVGASYGTAKSGIAVTYIGLAYPQKLMKSLIPVIMAGMIGIYGLLISVYLVTAKLKAIGYTDFESFMGFAAGLSVGLAGLAAGMCIGIAGDAGVRSSAIQDKVYTPMIVILVFAEALGIYGLIVGLICASKSS